MVRTADAWQPLPKDWATAADPVVECPVCSGSDSMHPTEVRVYTGAETTVVDHDGTTVVPKGVSGQARGVIIEIDFDPEQCLHELTLRFWFHKGSTYIDYRVTERPDPDPDDPFSMCAPTIWRD